MKYSIIAGFCILTISTPAFSQDASREMSEYQTHFRAAIMASLSHDYEQAEVHGRQALEVAEGPMEIYRANHLLTDVNARQSDWEEAADFAQAGRMLIAQTDGLPEQLDTMASHLAAEEWRARSNLNPDFDATALVSEFLDLHLEAADWSQGGVVVTHDDGLRCPAMIGDYLLFDVYESPGCQYWALNNIGVRVDISESATLDGARQTMIETISERTRSAWNEVTGSDTGPDLGDESALIFESNAPGGVSRYVIAAWDQNADRVSLQVRYPEALETLAISDTLSIATTVLPDE